MRKARWRDANAKFDRRFRYMELFARTSGRELNDMSLDELEDLWQAAKNRRLSAPPAGHRERSRATATIPALNKL